MLGADRLLLAFISKSALVRTLPCTRLARCVLEVEKRNCPQTLLNQVKSGAVGKLRGIEEVFCVLPGALLPDLVYPQLGGLSSFLGLALRLCRHSGKNSVGRAARADPLRARARLMASCR